MVWYIIAIVCFAIAAVLLIYTRVRDSRYDKKKTSEIMSEELKQEIEEEREAALDRQRKFNEALKKAGSRKHEA